MKVIRDNMVQRDNKDREADFQNQDDGAEGSR